MNILVIAPHPDDETLGCAGALLRHKAEGDKIHWVIVTKAHTPQWSANYIERKSLEIAAVGNAYGMSMIEELNFPATQLDEIPLSKLIDGLRLAIEKVRPDIVYLIHDGDVHTDHHAVFTATMSVLKTFYMKKCGVKRILSCETLSSTEAAPPQPHRLFVPNVYLDITPYLDKKIELMGMYTTEVQPDPMPRGQSAIRALARYRGASISVEYAEAFMLIREVL
jgi:N-acetylglucosamine malate deacetylase 1